MPALPDTTAFDPAALALIIGAVCALASFALGRRLSRRWRDRRDAQRRQAERAGETRQQRRARERGQAKARR